MREVTSGHRIEIEVAILRCDHSLELTWNKRKKKERKKEKKKKNQVTDFACLQSHSVLCSSRPEDLRTELGRK